MDFLDARQKMVAQQIRPWSVANEDVLCTLSEIPREVFVPSQYSSLAYVDEDIPLMENQSMLPPKTVGRALDALNIQPNEVVLEVGTGTGYVTACLGRIAKQVTSIEVLPELLEVAKRNLAGTREMDNITLEEGNGLEGYPPHAPYDAILVSGSCPRGIPEALLEQLKIGGRLFGFCGTSPAMRAVLITRTDSGYKTKVLFETVVPALINAPEIEKFVF